MKESPYDAEIKALTDERHCIGKELAEAESKRAKFLCPFEIGDILADRKGKTAELVRITSSYKDYRLEGALMRKDGTPGRIAILYDWDGWHKKEKR